MLEKRSWYMKELQKTHAVDEQKLWSERKLNCDSLA